MVELAFQQAVLRTLAPVRVATREPLVKPSQARVRTTHV